MKDLNKIDWKTLNAISGRTTLTLCQGEISKLTAHQIDKINDALMQMGKLSEVLYNEFEIARNLFRHSDAFLGK